MNDIDVALRRLVDDIEPAAVEIPPFEVVTERVRRRRRSRRAMTATVIVAAMAIVVSLTAAVVLDDDPTVDSAGPGPSTADPSVLGGPIPPPPLELRGDAALAWTGTEVVVWGGDVEAFNMGVSGEDRSYADGAVYDPASNRWRRMSESPLPSNDLTPVAVMTPEGVAIARGTEVALWDPTDDTWDVLPDADRPISDLHATGDLLVSASSLATLDLAGDRTWHDLPAPAVALERPSYTWAEGSLFVIGGVGLPLAQAEAYLLDVEDRSWRATSPPPEGLRSEALATAWDGHRVLVVNYDMTAVAYVPADDRWTLLPDVPARFFEHQPSFISGDGPPVVLMAAAAVLLRTDDDSWVPVPAQTLDRGTTISTGGAAILVWSVDAEARVNRLHAVDRSALLGAADARIQVGLASVAAPAGLAFAEAELQHSDDGTSDTVVVRFQGAGGTCEVTSTYLGMEPRRDDLPIEELDGETTWRRSEDDRRWQTWTTTSDRFEIRCDAPDHARSLAGSYRGPPSG